MPASPRRFGHQNITFPREISTYLHHPVNNIFQGSPITDGPNTLIAFDGSTGRIKEPRRFSTPMKSGATGGYRGIRMRSVTTAA